MKTEPTNLLIDSRVKASMAKLAAANGRSLSAEIRIAIAEHLEAAAPFGRKRPVSPRRKAGAR